LNHLTYQQTLKKQLRYKKSQQIIIRWWGQCPGEPEALEFLGKIYHIYCTCNYVFGVIMASVLRRGARD